MTLDLQSLILGVLLAGIAVLLRETFARVSHQRDTLRRDVYELTNVFPLWLSRFHPEFERLHGEFPPTLSFNAPPFKEEQQIRTLITDIQTHCRWPLVRGYGSGQGGVIQIVVDLDGRQNQGCERRLPDN